MHKKNKDRIKAFLALSYDIFRSKSARCQRNILCYHGVSDTELDSFRLQAEYMANHFKVVNPREILDTDIDGRPVLAIVFDDALESVARNALPILRSLNLPAAIAVPAGYFSAVPAWEMDYGASIDEKVMSREAIRLLAENRWEIHSHTMSHPRLAELSENEIDSELTESLKILNTLLPNPVTAICYPHGSHDRRVIAAVERAGYRMGFSITPGQVRSSDNRFSINRTVITPAESVRVLRLKASGAYSIFPKITGLMRKKK